jgi:hypothetical protein
MRNGIHVEIPPQFIFCRNLGFAPLSAIRTFHDFNPAITGHAPYALRTAIVPAREPATIKKTPKCDHVLKMTVARDPMQRELGYPPHYPGTKN